MAAPVVITNEATFVGETTATLNGYCSWALPGGPLSYVIFQWGKTPALDEWTTFEVAIPEEFYSYRLTGLDEATNYQFRLVGREGNNYYYGDTKTFKTLTAQPTPSPSGYVDRIIQGLNNLTNYFYYIYLDVRDWGLPFSYIAPFFLTISNLFNSIAWAFYDFSGWFSNVTSKVAGILSYENIASHFRSFFDAASDALDWVRSAFTNVTGIITTWWSSARLTVQGWIDIAKQTLQSAIDTVSNSITSVKEAWDSFKGKIPSINEVLLWFTDWRDKVVATAITWGALTATQIQELLASKIKELQPLLAGWLEMRDQVVEFFTDPGKWFMDRIESWLERFW